MKVDERVATITLPTLAELHDWVCAQPDHAVVGVLYEADASILARYLAAHYPGLCFETVPFRMRGAGYVVVWQASPRRRLGSINLTPELNELLCDVRLLGGGELGTVIVRHDALSLWDDPCPEVRA